MKINKLILLAGLSMIVTSCGPKDPAGTDKKSEEEILVQEEDYLGLIPKQVLDYRGDIDILTYVEGQNGTINDIGNPRVSPDELMGTDLARYAAAAREFRKIAPGVKINVIYCSINEFNNRISAYKERKGHLPHLMHPTQDFYEMMENGFVAELSKYKDSEYYQSISSRIMDDCTFGNFVAAFPTHYAPYGMFVNKDILKKHYIVDTDDEEEYRDWIDNLTFSSYIDACKNTYEPGVNAGFSAMMDIMGSYCYEDAYYSYVKGGDSEINLTSNSIRELIENEAELVKYSVYEYNDGTKTVKSDFPEVHNWSIVSNFVDGYFTFNTEMPWNIGLMSQNALVKNKNYNNFDFIPYPRSSDTADAIYGNAVGGLQVGNLCPVGENGAQCYAATAELEQDVAAYFTLFMIADPRAVKAESEILYSGISGDNPDGAYAKGYVSLPMAKKDFRFSYQDDDEILEKIGGDPTEGFNSLFDYQLDLYLETYPLYFDESLNNGKPDVVAYSNISYGLMKIINAITDEENDAKVVNYRHIPQNIQEGGELVDILYDWVERYAIYKLGSESYVASLADKLSEIESNANEKTATAQAYLQEMVDLFYGDNVYDIY